MRARGAEPPRKRPRLGRASPDRFLLGLAKRLIEARASALPAEILAALAGVARRAGAEGATVFDRGPHGGALAAVHHWSRSGSAPALATLPGEELPWLLGELAAGRSVSFRSCAELPCCAARERALFARHGPGSAAMIPLVTGGAASAVLTVWTLERERSWSRAGVSFLERAGAVLASALSRARTLETSHQAADRLAGVLEAVPHGVLVARPSGQVELANARAGALFLRGHDELCSARLQDLLASAQDAMAPGAGPAFLASDEPHQLSARRGDGSATPVEVTLRRLRTSGEELLYCGIRDVTEERRAREESARLRDELAFVGRTAMLAELGAGVAHELNQPLSAILSNAEAAQRMLRSSGAEREDLGDLLRDVVDETLRAAGVIRRMRDMLRHREAERRPVDVAELLRNVARSFREEAVARAIRLELVLVPDLPPVMGDAVQLQQVATNLVLNAFEAMGTGAGGAQTVTIHARPTQPDGVDVSVRDSGPGLSGEALAHAFEPFFTTKPGGIGMGLRISRSIVEAHGGRLVAHNNPDGGATFEFHVPAATRMGASRRESA